MKRNSKRTQNIWEEYHGMKKPKGTHLHHKDGNPSNDLPDNIICLTVEEHRDEHLRLYKLNGNINDLRAYNFLKNWRYTNSKLLGKKRSTVTKNKISNSLQGHVISEQTKQKISNGNKGKYIPKEIRIKISNTLTGFKRGKQTDKHKKNLSDSLKGKVPYNKGLKQKVVICPHCNKSGGIQNMKRYHFENCKLIKQKQNK